MKWLQGTYTQRFNNRHCRRGHLFQGRYKAIPVDGQRQRTTVPLRRVSERLATGHYTRASHAVSRTRRRPDAKLEKLSRKLYRSLDANES